MSKSRFSTPDVQAMVRDLRGVLLGLKLINLYDINDKTYLFKFSSRGVEEKMVLLLESGIRFHTTKYSLTKSDMPSPFAMKLRKYIRSKRLDDIRQVSSDRVVDFKFGSAEFSNHLILELYANGNIVLTDNNYEILALLHSHQFEEDIATRVGEIYPLDFATVARVIDALPVADNTSGNTNMQRSVVSLVLPEFFSWAAAKDKEATDAITFAATAVASGGKKSKAKKAKGSLRQLLLHKDSGVAHLGGEVLDHCILAAGLSPNIKTDEFSTMSIATWDVLRDQLSKEGPALLDSLDAPGQPGYIFYTQITPATIPASSISSIDSSSSINNVNSDAILSAASIKEYVEFSPFRLNQHKGKPCLSLPSFDEAVDEYYGRLESQRLARVARQAEETAKKKVDKVKKEQQSLLDGLSRQQLRMQRAAGLVEFHAEDVDKVLLVLNSALGAGMSWADTEAMVKSQTAAGNALAGMVVRLRLDRNKVTLRLWDVYADDDEHSEKGSGEDIDSDSIASDEVIEPKGKSKSIPVKGGSVSAGVKDNWVEAEVDLALSAHANARELFGHKKAAQAKEARTAEAAAKAVKQVEQQAARTLEKVSPAGTAAGGVLRAARKVHWFEKFNWFASSEGYLVLSGRDAQQNELLVKRYLRQHDIYVHADLTGAASCIVRNRSTTAQPIGPITLHEAGVAAVCRSVAWTNKIVASAWWVYASQVSKTAPSGEYIGTGSFIIRGKKNFLPPNGLEMGFGVLFRLADECVPRHRQLRRDRRAADRDADTESVMSEAFDRYGLAEPGIDDAEGWHGYSTTATAPTLEAILESCEDDACNDAKGIENKVSLTLLDEEGWDQGADEQDYDNYCGESDFGADDNGPDNNRADEDLQGLAAMEAPAAQVRRATGQVFDSTSNSKKSNKLKLEKKTKGMKASLKTTASAAAEKGRYQTQLISQGTINTATQVPSSHQAVTQHSVTRKKAVNKQKQRRYAEQDEEDRTLALRALGHVLPGEPSEAQWEGSVAERLKKDQVRRRQLKAGVLKEGVSTNSHTDVMKTLPPPVREALECQFKSGLLPEDSLDPHEIRSLAAMDEGLALNVLRLFAEGLGDANKRVGNRSGFLAGIMKRALREAQAASASASAAVNMTAHNGDETKSTDTSKISTRGKDDIQETASGDDEFDSGDGEDQREAGVEAEVEDVELEVEAEIEADSEQDPLDALTGCPLPDDILLYAVPVCGPYAALQRLKHRVKLTPGVGKKGKACKQALEVFVQSRETTPAEKHLLRGLTDPEMVAVMIGDVRVSTPGLQLAKKAAKKQQRGQKKCHPKE